MITHRNVVKSLNSWLYQFHGFEIKKSDKWIGYLPLAHILELLAEMMMLVFGIPIGYSSPNTLTDKSTMIVRGGKGRLLKYSSPLVFHVQVMPQFCSPL